MIEDSIKDNPTAQWLMGLPRIGPYIAGTLLAHYNIDVARTPASYWAYAGLTKKFARAYNRSARQIVFMAGYYMRAHPHYNNVYRSKQRVMWERNLNGELMKFAFEKLQELGGRGRSSMEDAWLKGYVDINWVRQKFNETGLVPYVAPRGEGHPMLTPPHIASFSKRAYLRHVLLDLFRIQYYYRYGEVYKVDDWIEKGVLGYDEPPSPPWQDARA